MSVMVLEIFVTSYLPLLEFCFQLRASDSFFQLLMTLWLTDSIDSD
jgi:hypothetical protein